MIHSFEAWDTHVIHTTCMKKRDKRERERESWPSPQGTNYRVWGTEAPKCSFKDVYFLVFGNGIAKQRCGVTPAEIHLSVGIHTG
jgi:hypothetical protein